MTTKKTAALRKRARKIGAEQLCEWAIKDAEKPAKGKSKQAHAAVQRCFREWLTFQKSLKRQ